MFTGLVQSQGKLVSRAPRGDGFCLTMEHDFEQLCLGESIAVNGACLTVTSYSARRFDADCSKETARRSNLGSLPIGTSVHLERALQVGDRLGGHFVTGHVDAQLMLLEVSPGSDSTELRFELPADLRPFIAPKGSVTLDGVSLTVNAAESDSFSVRVVPHSLKETHLGQLKPRHTVNCEVDVLARYIVHLARVGLTSEGDSSDPCGNSDRDTRLRQALAKAGML